MISIRNEWEYQSFGALKAAEEGDAEALAEAIARGSKVNGVRTNGSYKTPLMLAAGQGRPDLLGLLLEAGADPNDGDGFGALGCTFISGCAACADMLLDHGATPPCAKSAVAALWNENGADVFMLLISRGAFTLNEARHELSSFCHGEGHRRAMAMVEAAQLADSASAIQAADAAVARL